MMAISRATSFQNIGGKWGISVRGVRKLSKKFLKLEKNIATQNFDNLKRALIIVEAEAVRLVAHGYYRPAINTGRLWQSITNKPVLFTGTRAEGVVGTRVGYSIFVHEGTIFMEKRPFLADALKNKKAAIQAIFVGGYRTAIRKTIIR